MSGANHAVQLVDIAGTIFLWSKCQRNSWWLAVLMERSPRTTHLRWVIAYFGISIHRWLLFPSYLLYQSWWICKLWYCVKPERRAISVLLFGSWGHHWCYEADDQRSEAEEAAKTCSSSSKGGGEGCGWFSVPVWGFIVSVYWLCCLWFTAKFLREWDMRTSSRIFKSPFIIKTVWKNNH